MPRLSPYGLIAMKAGSYQRPDGSWANLVDEVGPFVNIADWFTPDSLCYAQQVAGVNGIYTRNNSTGVVQHWDAPGPNQLVAGGGVWASKSDDGYSDIWGPNPRWNQFDWFPQCVDPTTGTIALTLTGSGQNLCVYQGHENPDLATLTPLIDGMGFGTGFAEGVLTIWWNGNWYHLIRGGVVTPTGSLTRAQMFPTAAWMNGWNLGHSPSYQQAIWMDWNPTRAVSIYRKDNHGAQVYRSNNADPIIKVVGSSGPGELPGEQQVFTVNLVDQTIQMESAHESYGPVPWTMVDLTAPPQPPIVVPDFPPTTLAIGIGIFDEPGGPCFYGDPHSPPSMAKAVFCDLLRDNLHQKADEARANGLPLDAYMDGPYYQPEQVPVMDGVTVRAFIQAYPMIGESVSAFRARLTQNVQGMVKAGIPFDFALAAYCQWTGQAYALDQQVVLDCERVSYDVGVEYGAGALWGYVYKKPERPPNATPVDGLLRFPNIAIAFQRMRAASADWMHFPPSTTPEEDDMPLPALQGSRFVDYWEFPHEPTFKAFQGDDGRWMSVNDKGEVYWVTGVNEGPLGPGHLDSSSEFDWDGGKIYVARRNGARYEGKVV